MDEIKDFIVYLKPLHLQAISPEQAEQKAQEIISYGEIEIKSIEES